MMAKMEIKTDSLDRLDEVVEEMRVKYQKMSNNNPSITYTLTINYPLKSVNIRVLDIGVQVN